MYVLILLTLFKGYAQEGKDTIAIYNKINSLNHNYYQNINKNPRTSLLHAEEAFSYFDQINDVELKFNIASNFATALFINNHYEKALSALDKVKSLNLKEKEKALYYTIRGLVENDLNHVSEAEHNYKNALQLYISLNDKDNEFTVLNNLGLLYNNIGDYKKSLEAYLRCYDIMNSLKTDVDRYKYFLNIGTVSYNLNDYENALKSYSSALEEAQKKEDTLRIYRTYEKIAQANLALDSLGPALDYYKKTLDVYKQLDLKKDVASILLQLGNIYYTLGKKETSLNYFKESENISSKNSYLQEEAEAMLKLGIYYQSLVDYNRAAFYYKKVIEKEPHITNLEILKAAYLGLYQTEKQNNNIALSLKYLEKNQEYDKIIRQKQLVNERDQIEARLSLKKKELELDNLKINYQLNELQLKNQKQKVQGLVLFAVLTSIVLLLILTLYFQKRKAERMLAIQNKKINLQNEKLQQINNDIKAQRKELSSLNMQKDQLLSIIAHDVKSPLTNLYNLLHILRNNIDSIKKEDLKKNLASIESNTANLLNLLNNILNWIISQSTGVKVKTTEFSLTELINSNLTLVESTVVAKDLVIEFKTDASNYIIKSDKDIVDLSLRNLLSNAVKFTHNKGKIEIEIIPRQNAGVDIKISDSGIGFDEKIHTLLKKNIEKVPITSGTNKEKGYGIGLSLCKRMLAKIDSKITYEKNDPSGSIFILHLSQQQKTTA